MFSILRHHSFSKIFCFICEFFYIPYIDPHWYFGSLHHISSLVLHSLTIHYSVLKNGFICPTYFLSQVSRLWLNSGCMLVPRSKGVHYLSYFVDLHAPRKVIIRLNLTWHHYALLAICTWIILLTIRKYVFKFWPSIISSVPIIRDMG